MTRDIVEVTWLDAHSRNEWHAPDDSSHSPHEVRSVGYLIRTDSAGVTIAQSHDTDNGDVGDALFVPEANLVDTRILRAAEVAA